MVAMTNPPKPTPFDPGNWGDIVDDKTIQNLPTPTQYPHTYRVLPHGTFVDMAERLLESHGFTLSEPVHYAAAPVKNPKIKDHKKYGRFLSLYGISRPDLPDTGDRWWEFALTNSYDMSTRAGGALGERVRVCSNGMTLGKVAGKVSKKHMRGLGSEDDGFESLYNMLDACISGIPSVAQDRVRRVEWMKNVECSDDDAKHCIMEAAREGVIGAAATMRVLGHWETPEHPEFRERTVDSLYNAFTSNDRGRNVITQASRFGRLDKILNDRFVPVDVTSHIDDSLSASEF